jgi:hypothetical protein
MRLLAILSLRGACFASCAVSGVLWGWFYLFIEPPAAQGDPVEKVLRTETQDQKPDSSDPMVRPPAFPVITPEEWIAMPGDIAILVLREWLRGLKEPALSAWVTENMLGPLRLGVIGALASEYPDLCLPFVENLTPPEMTNLLRGWACSRPAWVIDRLRAGSVGTGDMQAVLPLLLATDAAKTLEALRGSSSLVKWLNQPKTVRAWAMIEPTGATRELWRVDGLIGIEALWAGLSDEFVNKRRSWHMDSLVAQASSEQLLAMPDRLKKAGGNENDTRSALVAALDRHYHEAQAVPPPFLMAKFPELAVAHTLALMDQGTAPSPSTLLDLKLDQAQMGRLAEALLAQPNAGNYLKSDQMPAKLQDDLMQCMAVKTPDQLVAVTGVGADRKLAAAIRSGSGDAVISGLLATAGPGGLEKMVGSWTQWQTLGVHSPAAFRLADQHREAFADPTAWKQNALRDWLEINPISASQAVVRQADGPDFDGLATEIVDYCIRRQDMTTARQWAQRLTEPGQAALRAKHPTLQILAQ